ncbi:hypothetical protein SERLA73DRAFT_174847 [Serpula lacrymans var. lacrymans S7.3]|uniref:Uncharacterized protein n=2 Tax=Serpula lacrymans var. lacrymans TaxID=341189 RepID=F8PIL0_SERL3|nr:uncharacterized protein SERLADRAFT_456529 [Serpula lacrymans var. lacrymans S7.9]EGO03381.1 hypothetical protein SERLA73DRAFT_174847 [Serpula lacrymans var. lacrymans S7.3]EGO29152.1 hypothetical protein SERLADRAFT_456529 [Serpula lacrymans var. lacrymans S7.9]
MPSSIAIGSRGWENMRVRSSRRMGNRDWPRGSRCVVGDDDRGSTCNIGPISSSVPTECFFGCSTYPLALPVISKVLSSTQGNMSSNICVMIR